MVLNNNNKSVYKSLCIMDGLFYNTITLSQICYTQTTGIE